MAKLEIDIEKEFVKIALSDYASLAVKYKKVGSKGGADRQIFCPAGHTFFIEFKRPKGIISPHQEEFRDMMERYSKRTWFCNSLEKALRVLRLELEYERVRFNNSGVIDSAVIEYKVASEYHLHHSTEGNPVCQP